VVFLDEEDIHRMDSSHDGSAAEELFGIWFVCGCDGLDDLPSSRRDCCVRNGGDDDEDDEVMELTELAPPGAAAPPTRNEAAAASSIVDKHRIIASTIIIVSCHFLRRRPEPSSLRSASVILDDSMEMMDGRDVLRPSTCLQLEIRGQPTGGDPLV
jgi:hypothetical protein